jgi:hypothetical protein
MSETDEWTAAWTAEKVAGHHQVLTAKTVSGNALRILTKRRKAGILIATFSVDVVERKDLERVHTGSDVEFVMSVPKGAVFRFSAIAYAEANSFGLGGLSDLYVAINENSFREYISKETRFILRGLRQHTMVQNVARITDRLYEVHRYGGLGSARVLALNEYDLTAEAVRTGIERHGECDLILTSNPNCRPSSESIQAATSAGVRVLKWAELLGALNNAK